LNDLNIASKSFLEEAIGSGKEDYTNSLKSKEAIGSGNEDYSYSNKY